LDAEVGVARQRVADLTERTELDFPKRIFNIWTYYKGHKQLVLRSPHFTSIHEDTFPSRVDVLFKNVHALRLPTRMEGLSVRIADPDLAGRITREAGEPPDGDHRVFVLQGRVFSGYVIASVMVTSEDDGDDSGPSPLLPPLPRVRLSAEQRRQLTAETGR
jgi:hypothetical protein